MSQANAWDRQPDETAKAYAAFLHYRDQEPSKRTLTEAARRTYGPKGVNRNGMVVGRIWEWADLNEWRDRARAFDQHHESIRQAQWDQEIAEAARRDAQEAQLIQAALMMAPRALAEVLAVEGVSELKKLDRAELVRLAGRAGRDHALVGRFKRLSMGLGEGRIEITGKDGGAIALSDERAAEEALAPILGVGADRVVDELAARRRQAREDRKRDDATGDTPASSDA